MERIKQALELARKEREKRGEPVSVGSTGRQGHSHDFSEKAIEYSKTQQVDIPVDELREKRVITEQKNSISDSYRILRTQVLQRLRDKGWNTLAITSPGTGAGKSLTSINLGISLAREVSHTVLLVDANLRSPKLNKYFDFDTEYGLSDYLISDVPLENILVNPNGLEGFVVLPAGRAMADSSEMLSSPKMQRLVEELKYRYPSRIVLFDLPPVTESSDAMAFIPNVDATLMVIEDGKTLEQELKQAFQLMQGNEIIGTVLNKVYTTDKDYATLGVKQGYFSRLFSRISEWVLSSRQSDRSVDVNSVK